MKGLDGKEFAEGSHILPRLAASPDGRWIYMVGVEAREQNTPAVYRTSTDGDDRAKPFVGDPRSPGADDAHLNDPAGLDCDPDGRLYVADRNNNRVQVFSPEGKLVKTIPSDRPTLVRVHQKTGAVYVLHNTRIEGASVGRLTRFSPFPELKEVWHQDRMVAAIFAVDSWTANPRLWLAGAKSEVNTAGSFGSGPSVTIWEDDGKSIRKILDFDEEARKEEGANHIGRWGGAWVGPNGKVIADPVRERVYLDNRFIFDLRTGQRLGLLRIPAYVFDDIAVDKRGYIHFHMNPGLDTKGVGRVAPPAEGTRERDRSGQEETVFRGQEVPYDYGVDISPQYNTPLKGGLPVRDQGGPNGFQDGLGVNMRGDVAIESKIWYVPKMEDVGFDLAAQGWVEKQKLGIYGGDQAVVGSAGYQAFLRTFQDMEKRGEEVYTFRRRPGSPMAGGTVWVHHRTGELRGTDCTAAIGQIVDGVMIDEDQKLYFVNNRIRLFSDKPFLAGRGGRFGVPPEKWSHSPNTGTLIKSTGANVMVLEDKAPIPLDEPPGRPAELWKGRRCWVEGAEWFYAGASPITFGGCACPAQRLHTDWYKRTFVPETYRHSIGVLDTAGNLILHIGRYGNYDSGFGPGSRIPAGGDGIGMFQPRYIGGTDNYLCFSDWGERMVALKLDYHAEATVDILPPGGE